MARLLREYRVVIPLAGSRLRWKFVNGESFWGNVCWCFRLLESFKVRVSTGFENHFDERSPVTVVIS